MIKVLPVNEWSYDHNESTEERRRISKLVDEAEQQNTRLLLPYDLEWENLQQRRIWESLENYNQGKIKPLMARKCDLVSVPRGAADEFLNANHVQGAVRNLVGCWGLVDSKLGLVNVMTVGNAVNTAYDIELTRFCNLVGVTVAGGASRLWRHVCRVYAGKRAITYSDRRYAMGNLYKDMLGFQMIKRINPSYKYVGPNRAAGMCGKRHFRFKNAGRDALFMKAAKGQQITAPGMLPGTFFKYIPDAPESALMFHNGYRRVWDAGYVSWGQTIPSIEN